MSEEKAEQLISDIYEANEGSEAMESYHERHGIESLAILTVASAYAATREVDQFAHRIRGKVVIEIGGGVGFLALEMARFAKQVYAVEADPAWSWVFIDALYQIKPANLTWIFGAAESVAQHLRGDVAVIYTRSGHRSMEAVARMMCPEIIKGPLLELDERYPEMTPDVMAAAQKVAATVKPSDLESRRGFTTETINKLVTEGSESA